MRAPLAIVTMVYNERDFLPVWLQHYGAEVGLCACHVIDHGSDDGSTHAIAPANILRIPRSPQDDDRRATAVSNYCAALLSWYEAVIYVDVDELLVADPEIYSGLVDYARRGSKAVETATGFDIVHCPDSEAQLNWQAPLGGQRSWLRFSSAMCKAVLIRQPVAWVPGFHNTEHCPSLDTPLFLFHLRYADLNSGLDRLARTRKQPWVNDQVGLHQRMSNGDWEGMLRAMAGLPQSRRETLRCDDPTLAGYREVVHASTTTRANERYKLDLHVSGETLVHLPHRFALRL